RRAWMCRIQRGACVGDRIVGQIGGGLSTVFVRSRPQVRVAGRGRERLQYGAVRAEIEHVGAGLLFRGPHLHRVLVHQAGDARFGIVQITHPDRMGGAHGHAGRFEVLVHPVCTEVAFGGRVGLVVDVDRVVRATLHTGLTADAAFTVEVDDPVVAFEQRLGRADGHAGGVGAVVAAHHAEVACRGGEFARVDVFHPGTELSDGDVVLGFARHCAGVTPDTGVLVNGEAVLHATTS